ncbi:hypothetical protein PDIDSM_922 [Penicillium digitatum]|nr:hypothetical protein PDIDSM_922 [Penicillium digitatum]
MSGHPVLLSPEGTSRIITLGGAGCIHQICNDHDHVLKAPLRHNTQGCSEKTIKSVEGREEFSELCLTREKLVYQNLPQNHPNILNYFAITDQGIQLPYLRNGDVRSYSQNNPIDMKTRNRWIENAIDAISTIHACGIVHSDISPRNFLVADDLSIRLCDFAGSRINDLDSLVEEETRYRLPSHFRTTTTDIFALGSFIYEVSTGSLPFADIEDDDQIERMFTERKFPNLEALEHRDWILPRRRQITSPTTLDNPKIGPSNPTFHSLPAVASQSHTSLDEHIGAEEDVMQASYNMDFTINSHEIDISSAVPKLKGQSNFRDWETALYIALAANNRYYTYMISNGIPIPKIPSIRTPVLKLFAIFLLKKLRILQNGTASEFVRKFQETLRDLTSIDGKINSVYVLCQFKKAINENPKCYAFLQNLRVDEKDVNLMDQVYAEFLEKKDTKKGGNDKQSNSNNSSSNNHNKDKPSKKKTDFVREENVILCRHHGTLGNHYSNKCPLLKNSANATTIQQPQQQPLFQQVAVSQPGQIIGQVDNQGRILSLPQQQPRQGANAIFAPASYPTANAVHGSHIVSKEGLLANDNNDVTRWMIDSGTSTHMTPHRSVFVNFRRCVLPVSTATGDVFYTEGYGDVILHLLDQDSSGKMAPLTLQKVWLAPDLRSSLISMSALDKADIGTWTKNGMMTFKHQDFYGPETLLVELRCIDKIDHMIDCNLVTGSPNSVFATQREIIPISIDLAHRRACHAGEERVRKMEKFADGVKLKKGAGVTFPCAPCIKGKGHALPFGKERSIRSKPGEFIHLDVWGPISIASHGGEHYFVTFTDDATRFTWLFLLKSRSQVTEVYIQLETYLKTQFNYVIKKVHGDDAPEHKPLAAYLASKGTVWDPTPPYTKQLNGVAEIKNRHLVEPLVAVMAEYQLPKYLWGLLLGGINYTMNRLYASKIGMSPYEAFFGKKPNLSNLRALGCQCCMEEARLLAYDEGDNYVVYNVRTKKIERSRNVIFNENPSPASLPDPAYDLNITGMNQEHEHDSQDRHIPIDFLRPHLEIRLTYDLPPHPLLRSKMIPRIKRGLRMLSTRRIPRSLKKILHGQMMKWRAVLAGGRGVLVEPQPVSRQVVNMDIPLETTIDLSQEDPLQDDDLASKSFFDSNVLRLLAEQPEILVSLFANATSNEQYAVSKLTPKDIGFEPNSWEQAMSCVEKDKWLVAAHKELHRHLVNGTWRVMSRTKSKKKPLTLRWVFKVKHDGTYKARLVARGFRQDPDC